MCGWNYLVSFFFGLMDFCGGADFDLFQCYKFVGCDYRKERKGVVDDDGIYYHSVQLDVLRNRLIFTLSDILSKFNTYLFEFQYHENPGFLRRVWKPPLLQSFAIQPFHLSGYDVIRYSSYMGAMSECN